MEGSKFNLIFFASGEILNILQQFRGPYSEGCVWVQMLFERGLFRWEHIYLYMISVYTVLSANGGFEYAHSYIGCFQGVESSDGGD